MELYTVYRKYPPLMVDYHAGVWVVPLSYSHGPRLFLLDNGHICYGNYYGVYTASGKSFYAGAGVEHDRLELVIERENLELLTKYAYFDKILKGEFVLTLSINQGLPSLLTAEELLIKLR